MQLQESLEPLDIVSPSGRLSTRRFGWALFLWGTAVLPFYLITAGLPLLELHSLLAGGTPDSGVDRHGDAAGERR